MSGEGAISLSLLNETDGHATVTGTDLVVGGRRPIKVSTLHGIWPVHSE